MKGVEEDEGEPTGENEQADTPIEASKSNHGPRRRSKHRVKDPDLDTVTPVHRLAESLLADPALTWRQLERTRFMSLDSKFATRACQDLSPLDLEE